MADGKLLKSLKDLRSSTRDVSMRLMLELIIAETPASATRMTKEQAANMFLLATDWGQVTQNEIQSLSTMYQKVPMTSSCNRYMRGLLRHLKEGGGTWRFKRMNLFRNELLTTKNKKGEQRVFGIRGVLWLGNTKQCETLERPRTGTKRCVAPGTYTLRLRSKFSSLETDGIGKTSKKYTRIQIPDLESDRIGIQIHWGKSVSWSDGCTLVGKYDDSDKWLPNESEEVYKALLKAITGTDKAYQPKDEAEWSLIPKVKMVLSIIGDPKS